MDPSLPTPSSSTPSSASSSFQWKFSATCFDSLDQPVAKFPQCISFLDQNHLLVGYESGDIYTINMIDNSKTLLVEYLVDSDEIPIPCCDIILNPDSLNCFFLCAGDSLYSLNYSKNNNNNIFDHYPSCQKILSFSADINAIVYQNFILYLPLDNGQLAIIHLNSSTFKPIKSKLLSISKMPLLGCTISQDFILCGGVDTQIYCIDIQTQTTLCSLTSKPASQSKIVNPSWVYRAQTVNLNGIQYAITCHSDAKISIMCKNKIIDSFCINDSWTCSTIHCQTLNSNVLVIFAGLDSSLGCIIWDSTTKMAYQHSIPLGELLYSTPETFGIESLTSVKVSDSSQTNMSTLQIAENHKFLVYFSNTVDDDVFRIQVEFEGTEYF